MRTAREHILGWCRFRNDGYTPWPGPSGLSNPGDDVHGADKEDVASFNIVSRVIEKIGKGAYHPFKLIELLDHRYYRGGRLDTFSLLPPTVAYPKELIQLGMRKERLLAAVVRMVEKSVEEEASAAASEEELRAS